jgi:D-alanyl-D-alanine carboxypeptidase (penicillin-binding protein 5/6)
MFKIFVILTLIKFKETRVMRVIFRTVFLLYLIFFGTCQCVFAANKSAINKKIKNIKTEKIIEEDASNIIQYPNSTAITLRAKQVLVIDYSTGKILLEKNAYERMAPSSMTKIMTSYIIEEKIKKGEMSLDSEFIVSEKAWRMGGSKSFMPLGEKVRLDDILRGIIIQSGNDASIVAAEGLNGSEEEFVDVMNSKAQEMGMKNTNFVNSNGWPDENHYSTAYDLALLSRVLIKTHPEFYPIYSEKNFTFGKDQKGNPITQGNRNPLLYKDLGCDGIKTGYTDLGGYGIIASFVDKDRRYIAVINGLNSMKERANESAKIVQWVKQNFVNKKFYSKGDVVGEAKVWLGVKDKVHLEVSEDVIGLGLRSKQQNEINTKIEVPSPLSAPLEAGDLVGKMVVTIDGEVQEIPVIVNESVEKVGFFRQIIAYIASIF